MHVVLYLLYTCSITVRHPSVQVVGFADDYRFVGPAEEALAAADEYLRLVQARGHVSQVAKAKLYTPMAHVLARDAVRAHPLFQRM